MQTIIVAHIIGKNICDNYLFVSLKIIATQNPTCQVILFTDVNIIATENNFTINNIGKKSNIVKAYWQKFTLPALLKKLKASCFITNGKLCSNKITIPQYFYIEQEQFLTQKSIAKIVFKANAVIVIEDFMVIRLEKLVDKNKIVNVYHGLSQKPKLLSYNEIKSQQGEYTNGDDYFLFPINKSSVKYVTTVLKAFSILKKWQKTSLKLLLLLYEIEEDNLVPDFKNYKYKTDVFFVKETRENKVPITASAFGSIYLSDYKNVNNVFIAMQNCVPLIVLDNEINNSILDKAALYTQSNEAAIAEKMQALYKDEQLKKVMRIEADNILEKYDSEKTATHIYKIITA